MELELLVETRVGYEIGERVWQPDLIMCIGAASLLHFSCFGYYTVLFSELLLQQVRK